MAESELNAFLNGAAAAPEPAAAEPEPQAAPVESTPEPKADAAAKPDAKAAPEPEEDPEPPIAADGEPVVPRRALEDERHKRQDWKERAIRHETEAAELRKQLEEAKRAAAQPQTPPPTPQPPIDPSQDPQGFINRVQGVVLNERLNTSELLLRKELGADKVDAIIADFKQAAQTNPSLFQQLYAQPDPYGWAHKQVEILRAQREIGDDPAAYRERIRAEAIAEFQKTNGVTPRVSPAAGMAPSLATARSVAGRSAPAFTGPPSLDDILALRNK